MSWASAVKRQTDNKIQHHLTPLRGRRLIKLVNERMSFGGHGVIVAQIQASCGLIVAEQWSLLFTGAAIKRDHREADGTQTARHRGAINGLVSM